MLIDAICEQAGYTGEDEGEARTSKNQDIVFLDQETRLSLLVKVDGVVRNLNGKVDFAIWYESGRALIVYNNPFISLFAQFAQSARSPTIPRRQWPQ